jgi:hypothetical protein
LIVGVARSGTTSLYHYLKDYDSIYFPEIKEPKYFSRNAYKNTLHGLGDDIVKQNIIDNEESYLSLFKKAKGESVIAEASSDYFYHYKSSIPEIKNLLGDPKIIILLRDPSERSFSAYSNLVRDSREKLSFIDGIKMEDKRIVKGYDWMWHYLKGSLYCDGVGMFMNNFTNVKIIFYKDLVNKTSSTIKETLQFLGVNEELKENYSVIYSKSGQPKNKFISKITSRHGILGKIRVLILKLVPRNITEYIASKLIERQKVESVDLNFVISQAKKDVHDLSIILPEVKNKWPKYFK